MGILLISATNSSDSINRKIMDIVLSEGFFEYIDFMDFSEIPLLSKDIQTRDGIPEDILKIYEEFKGRSVLVFFAPEHNGYISAYFKNIVDGLSRVKRDFLAGKRVMLVSVGETMRDRRVMENSIVHTFNCFSPDSFSFVNFNKYGLDPEEDIRRAKDLVSSIKDL